MATTALVIALASAAVAQSANLAGQLLVASERMSDPRFYKTVIYVVRHDASGALGLIVNRPVAQVSAADLMRDLGREAAGTSGTIRVHFGGPVGPRRGFVLHTPEWKEHDTEALGNGFALTAGLEVVEAIAHGTGPRHALFLLGYAGWAPRQLEAELAADAWVTVSADAALVFDEDVPTKWERAMARRKINL